jgi:phosphopantetheinyl transferase (holo-ACP synthase)
VDVLKNRQDIAVHAVSFDHRGGPAFYASLPNDGEMIKEFRQDGEGGKNLLASILLDHVVATGSPLWKYRHSFDSAAFPIRLARSPLGKPCLLLGEYRGPAISFSAGGGKVWAALCGDESEIGIDLAAPDEFRPAYPLHRVFHDHELKHALRLTDGDLAEASALLWSIKEAVVKAMGCGFHLVAPRQVHVCPSVGKGREFTFRVCFSRKVMGRFPTEADRPIWVRSFPWAKMWFSIALLSRQPS